MSFEIVNIVGAAANVAMGLLGIFAPKTVEGIIGMTPQSKAGRSEYRSTYGGLFLALGVVPLLTLAPEAFAVSGVAWLFTAIFRTLSIFMDDASDSQNWGAVGFETFIAALLLVGAPAATIMAASQ